MSSILQIRQQRTISGDYSVAFVRESTAFGDHLSYSQPDTNRYHPNYPPSPPPGRLIRDGGTTFCPLCGSSMKTK